MTLPRSSASNGAWVVWMMALVLVFAPLIRGGNRPLALLALELGALLLLASVLAQPQQLARIPRVLMFALVGLFVLPLVQLIPLLGEWAQSAAGRLTYEAGFAAFGLGGGFDALSVVPMLTELAWLALLPSLAVFLVVVGLRGEDVERLVLVFIGMACFQAVLALMQFGAGPDTLLRLGMEHHHQDSGVGTYPSRNNLAGLLEMALPIALALFAASIFRLDRDTRVRSQRHSSWWARLKRSGTAEGQTNRTVVYAVVCLLVLLGLVFSRSRMGIAMGMVGLVLTTLLLARNFGGRFSANLVGVMSSVGVVLATTIGLAPVFARFSQDPLADGRWPIFEASWRAVVDFFPLGSGAGTYPAVITSYHSAEVLGDTFINHAHNDYLEWLVEGGVVALVLLLLFAVAYALQWRKVWAERNWQTLHMMQVGAGVGIFVLMLHGLTDYNLRIPANQIYFALLAAVFFHPGAGEQARSAPRRSHGTSGAVSPVLSPRAVAEALPGAALRTPAVSPRPVRAATAAPVVFCNEAAAAAWRNAPSAPDQAGKGVVDSSAPEKPATPHGDNPFANKE